ncbi:uncharacterized protein TRAVEDRAFT_42754 [Trametes versicolor FP-101664 SS1]|uniref:uncharacterized protein n=1 Tax=Trametes versicolor (strain FP-101664) TaxID=717944 RepID=UPI00046218C4|nr:uncharacterized protein TRAVEDRAFT_42754 [Trametes versicolor FP-101664 SS1]EIW65383.1 hypothetical protein TRAVEDRAFT_42754 [Trametes versicolor FP-101664 SS1]
MRLPFFDSLTALELWDCTFNSLRAMMDVVWAFPNLASLKVLGCTIATKRGPTAAGVLLSTSCQQLRACQALVNLELDWASISSDLSSTVAGSIFGCSVTRLHIFIHDAQTLASFLHGSFPALRCITVDPVHIPDAEAPSAGPVKPWLHAVAASQALPGTLKKIDLTQSHAAKSNEAWCEEVVGKSEEVNDARLPLPRLLSGLEELRIRFNYACEPAECAAHIYKALPSMGQVLHLGYGGSASEWTEYQPPPE